MKEKIFFCTSGWEWCSHFMTTLWISVVCKNQHSWFCVCMWILLFSFLCICSIHFYASHMILCFLSGWMWQSLCTGLVNCSLDSNETFQEFQASMCIYQLQFHDDWSVSTIRVTVLDFAKMSCFYGNGWEHNFYRFSWKQYLFYFIYTISAQYTLLLKLWSM